MKRMTYVDSSGNATNVGLERRKPLLKFFFVFGTILPLVIIILITYTVIQNKKCINIYDAIKSASLRYAQDQEEMPTVNGENINVNISDLYSEQFLKSSETNGILCSGNVKITKYEKEYIYTLDVRKCNKCSTNEKYGNWSELQTSYPRNKAIVDVVPYYNYYDRELNITKWSKYYEEEELEDEVSKYGIKLPKDTAELPEIPQEGKETKIENDTIYYYRYSDRTWKWYDIEGDYSEFSSEKPDGYANRDDNTQKYTEWSEYSLDYPAEKDYRVIEKTTGYKFYYVDKSGKKIYYNSGKYTPREEVNREKYDKQDNKSSELFRYRDKQWRWYNGQKRRYSSYSSKGSSNTPIKDNELEKLENPSQWSEERKYDPTTQEYRSEEQKLMTRFRKQYEILSLQVLKSPLEKEQFEKKENMSISEFNDRDDKKLETTYKFRYKKS